MNVDRALIVQKAGNELERFSLELAEKYELTYAERMSILGQMIASAAKWEIRRESDLGNTLSPGSG